MSIKNLIQCILQNAIVWTILEQTIGRLSKVFIRLKNVRFPRSYLPTENLRKFCEKSLCNNKVLYGPFKGMQYPNAVAQGSAFYPKLIGSYERELHDCIEELKDSNYDVVIDIGCAEGYYAVGLARMFPKARTYAFDTNKKAKRFCEEMALLNNVEINIGEFCTIDTIKNLNLQNKSLIFSDCEGYEKELFTNKSATLLAKHDAIIESHTNVDIEMTKRILKALEDTHDCKVIESVDDIMKAYSDDYNYEVLENLSMQDKCMILSEGRGCVMHWIIARSRYTN